MVFAAGLEGGYGTIRESTQRRPWPFPRLPQRRAARHKVGSSCVFRLLPSILPPTLSCFSSLRYLLLKFGQQRRWQSVLFSFDQVWLLAYVKPDGRLQVPREGVFVANEALVVTPVLYVCWPYKGPASFVKFPHTAATFPVSKSKEVALPSSRVFPIEPTPLYPTSGTHRWPPCLLCAYRPFQSPLQAPAAQETHSITIVTVFEVVPAAVTTTLISPAPAKLRGSGPMLT